MQTVQAQLDLFASAADRSSGEASSTFADNLSLPIHRWFRYSAGFSALWARELIRQEAAAGRRHILDPFAGSGTVLLEAELCGVESLGLEAHPFVARLARAKLQWRESPQDFEQYALAVLEAAKATGPVALDHAALIEKCYPADTLARLHALRGAWEHAADASPRSELTWLCLISILRGCSPVGTAQWQYVLPKKRKSSALEPYEAYLAKAHDIAHDMAQRQRVVHGPLARLERGDARTCATVADQWADLVVTSPPYANNYDYADATRLEMTFMGEVRRWRDLQEAVRRHLVRSCTQHVSEITDTTDAILRDEFLCPIRGGLAEVCAELAEVRESRGGRKPYHTMLAAYFSDMAHVWVALRRVTRAGALVCFVIGDSAPYGVYVPVDRWLGELAVAAGFRSFRFEKTRERNVKWRNRKHRVPLKEGRLWVEG